MKIQLLLIVLFACTSCKPSLPEGINAGTLPAPLVQCGKDTDCKGERVCGQGACVEPRNVPTSDVASAQEHLVFNEPLSDIYSNNWYAYPLDIELPGSPSFIVIRYGKDAELTAKLTINCTDTTSYWEWGLQYGTDVVDESFFTDQVPNEVVANILKKYCK